MSDIKWRTPCGAMLQVLGDPPMVPVLRITRLGRCTDSLVLRDDDRAWLHQQLAPFDPAPAPSALLRWTRERPTAPGFYFMRFPVEQLPFDGATRAPDPVLRTVVVKADQCHDGLRFYEGQNLLNPGTEFAGPIPLPEE